MASSWLLYPLSFFHIFSLLILASSSPTPIKFLSSKNTAITLSLTKLNINPHKDPILRLNHLVSSSLTRAHHLKAKNSKINHVTITPLFAHSYGGYSVSLKFGTPAQEIPLLVDTGSSPVWVPCTSRYTCKNCTFSKVDPTKIVTFIPNKSSTAKILACQDPKCGWIFNPDVAERCDGCGGNLTGCACPTYFIVYGSGSTAGLFLIETLDLSHKIPNFVVGCSLLSTRQPTGIVGFGRSLSSMPSQLGLSKFSYCLLSDQYDDDPSKSSPLVLVSGAGEGRTPGVSCTPFIFNPNTTNPAFQEYYYVYLQKVIVGGREVKISNKYLLPGVDGNGGTIVDSGTTFTVMDGGAFEPLAQEVEAQMAKYERVAKAEIATGLRPCFNLSGKESVQFPNLIFQFKGGAKMKLPQENYFSAVLKDIVCMTILDNRNVDLSVGPSIIIGNSQQQNFYMEYDLKYNRLGFKRQDCSS